MLCCAVLQRVQEVAQAPDSQPVQWQHTFDLLIDHILGPLE